PSPPRPPPERQGGIDMSSDDSGISFRLDGPVSPSAGPPPGNAAPRLSIVIAGRVLGAGDVAVHLGDTLYVFSLPAIESGSIQARWANPSPLHRVGKRMMLRTLDDVVKIDCNSLDAALAHLPDLPLVRVYHGTAVAIDKISEVDFAGKLKRVGFVVG